MSQEEEKFIQELNEEIWWDSDLSEGENWKKYIVPLILKSYRSGKLAWMEKSDKQWKYLSDVVKMMYKNKEFPNLNTFFDLCKVIREERSLIEEERKKL